MISFQAQSFTRLVLQSSASSALFGALDPVLPTQDTLQMGQTPNRHYMADRMPLSLPQPQRTASYEIPPTQTAYQKSPLATEFRVSE